MEAETGDVNLEEIQAVLGHKSISTTKIYRDAYLRTPKDKYGKQLAEEVERQREKRRKPPEDPPAEQGKLL
jgi:integrase